MSAGDTPENTMADLREECASRMRSALHGREIDTLENTVALPQMLDITPIGAIHTKRAECGTLLDPEHQFWENYCEDVSTRGGVRRRVKSAIHSLSADGTFDKTHPYGREADIVYCEVDVMDRGAEALSAECDSCGEMVDAPLSLELNDGFYELSVSIDCPHCRESLERSVILE